MPSCNFGTEHQKARSLNSALKKRTKGKPETLIHYIITLHWHIKITYFRAKHWNT